jgi:hypothetical protein
MFTILAEGNWARSQVKCEWTASTRACNLTMDAQIEAAWRSAAAREGIKLFDGLMCRLESYRASAGRLELRLSRTSYKIFLGTNLAGADRFDSSQRANPIGLSPALLTIDGHLIMGRRNSRVAYYPNRIHPFAGALEPKDGADVFAGMLRELNEELSLEQDAIESMRCIGLAEDDALRQPELIFHVRTRLTKQELSQSMDADEHFGLWSIPATRDALRDIDDHELTPIALATISLWSRSM